MPRVLIIEDTEEMRVMLKGYMERILKYEVLEATDGLEGIKLAQAQQPDVIILDLMMPVASGDLTLGYIRSTAKLKDIPIIVSSAHIDAQKISKQLGADHCLPKPYDLSELKKAVELVMEKAAAKPKEAESPAAGLATLAAKLESMKATKPAEAQKTPEAPRTTLDPTKAAQLAKFEEEAKAAELEAQKAAAPVSAESAKPVPPTNAEASKPAPTPLVNEAKPAAEPTKPTAPTEPAKPASPSAQTPVTPAP